MTNDTIKAIRSKTGLSQVKFSRVLHIPRRTLEDWEAGVRLPPAYVVELLEYRVSTDPLLSAKDSKDKGHVG